MINREDDVLQEITQKFSKQFLECREISHLVQLCIGRSEKRPTPEDIIQKFDYVSVE